MGLLADFLAGVAGGIPGIVDANQARAAREQEIERLRRERETEYKRNRDDQAKDWETKLQWQVAQEARQRATKIEEEQRQQAAKEAQIAAGGRGLLGGMGLTPEQIAMVESGQNPVVPNGDEGARLGMDEKAFHAARQKLNDYLSVVRTGTASKEITQSMRAIEQQRALDNAKTPEERRAIATRIGAENASLDGKPVTRVSDGVQYNAYDPDEEATPTAVGEARIRRYGQAGARDSAEKGAIKDTNRLTALNADIARFDRDAKDAQDRLDKARAELNKKVGKTADRGLQTAVVRAADELSAAQKNKANAEAEREQLSGVGSIAKPKVASSTNLPPAPQDPGQRVVGKVYGSKFGPVEWTGTGWRRVNG